MKNKSFYHVDRTRSLFLTMEACWKLTWAAIRIRIPFGRKNLLQRAIDTRAISHRVPCFRGPGSSLTPWVRFPGAAKACHPASVMQTTALINALNRVRRFHPKGMYCLEQSLALVWMLRRRGVAATLQIGCRRDGSEFRFHAWVAGWDGTPLESSDIENRFAPFASLSC